MRVFCNLILFALVASAALAMLVVPSRRASVDIASTERGSPRAVFAPRPEVMELSLDELAMERTEAAVELACALPPAHGLCFSQEFEAGGSGALVRPSKVDAAFELRERLDEITALVTGGDDPSRELMDAERALAEAIATARDLIDAIDVIEQRLRDPAIETRVAAAYLRSVAEAGTPAARSLLAEVVRDVELPLALRRAAVDGAILLRSRGRKVTDSLVAVLNAWDDDELRLSCLGALAQLASTRASDPSSQDRAIEALLEYESRASSDGLTSAWLSALGRTGSAEVVPVLRVWLESPDPAVAAAAGSALSALDRYNDPDELGRAVARNTSLVVSAAFAP